MENFSQLDPRWAHTTLGRSIFTIGRFGCTTTAICDLIQRLAPSASITPAQAAKLWAYTSEGLIIWGQSKFEPLKFEKRGYGANWAEIEDAAQANKGIILEVNHSHWVAVRGVNQGRVEILDPLGGTVHDSIPSRYTVTGYAIFSVTEVKPEISSYAKKAVDRATALKIATDWSEPQKIVCDAEAEIILMRTGLLERKAPQGGLTKEDFVHLLYRIKAFE